jgi:hypothetical protein
MSPQKANASAKDRLRFTWWRGFTLMAEELCEIDFIRRNPRLPIVVFVRVFNQAGATVLAFPWRLERGITRTWPMKLDPTLSVEVVSGEPDEEVSARIMVCGPPPGLLGRAIIWGAARLSETSGCGKLNRNRRYRDDSR